MCSLLLLSVRDFCFLVLDQLGPKRIISNSHNSSVRNECYTSRSGETGELLNISVYSLILNRKVCQNASYCFFRSGISEFRIGGRKFHALSNLYNLLEHNTGNVN